MKGKQRAKFGRVFHDKMYRQESDSAIILPQISIMDTDYDYQDEPSIQSASAMMLQTPQATTQQSTNNMNNSGLQRNISQFPLLKRHESDLLGRNNNIWETPSTRFGHQLQQGEQLWFMGMEDGTPMHSRNQNNDL